MRRIAKRIIAWLAYHLYLWQGVARLCRLADDHPLLVAFTFHRILDEPPPKTFIQGYERGRSRSSFVVQLESICRLFDICGLGEFVDFVSGRVPPGHRPVALLTFDDADSLHGRVAFTDLLHRELPAVSFVPTGFIESDRRFYHLRLTNICNHLSKSDWNRLAESPMPAEARDVVVDYIENEDTDRRTFRRRLIPPFHTMDVETRDRLLDQWERLVPDYTLGIECASWDEIRSWERQGIDIGSHTVSHHRLTLLESEEIRQELELSRQTLREELQGAINSVSYPEGSYTDAVPIMAEQAGYEIGFTTHAGFVSFPVSTAHRYLIPRISIGGDSRYAASYELGRIMLKHLLESARRRLRYAPPSASRALGDP